MLIKRRIKDNLVGMIYGKPFTIPYSEDNEKALLELADDFSADALEELVMNANSLSVASKLSFMGYNPRTKVYYIKDTDIVLPKFLGEQLEALVADGTDTEPLEKFWLRVLNNPRVSSAMISNFYNYISQTWTDVEQRDALQEQGYSRDEAVELATYQDIAITKEGLLATYKVVDIVDWKHEIVEDEDNPGSYKKVKSDRYKKIPAVVDEVTGEILKEESLDMPSVAEDYLFTPAICKSGDLFFSGTKLGYTYKVGEMQRLPEKATRNLKNTFGGGGLYIGGLRYIAGYRQDSNKTLLCFVNPGDVLSFQSDGAAIRTDALFPYGIADMDDVKNSGKYHSSDYAGSSDDRIKKIVSSLGDKKYSEIQKAINDAHETITAKNYGGDN